MFFIFFGAEEPWVGFEAEWGRAGESDRAALTAVRVVNDVYYSLQPTDPTQIWQKLLLSSMMSPLRWGAADILLQTAQEQAWLEYESCNNIVLTQL